MADRAFAVRACDVHRAVSPFRMTKQLDEPLDARKAELRAEDVETFEVREPLPFVPATWMVL